MCEWLVFYSCCKIKASLQCTKQRNKMKWGLKLWNEGWRRVLHRDCVQNRWHGLKKFVTVFSVLIWKEPCHSRGCICWNNGGWFWYKRMKGEPDFYSTLLIHHRILTEKLKGIFSWQKSVSMFMWIKKRLLYWNRAFTDLLFQLKNAVLSLFYCLQYSIWRQCKEGV